MKRSVSNIGDLAFTGTARRLLFDVVDKVRKLAAAIKSRNCGAVIWIAARAHPTLADVVENCLTDDELRQIWSKFDTEVHA